MIVLLSTAKCIFDLLAEFIDQINSFPFYTSRLENNDRSNMHGSMIVDNLINLLQVDLLRGQKTDRVDVTLQPEELDALDNVLPAK